MALPSSYDIIIAGAGASGLSLAWYIMQSEQLRDKKVLLLDLSLEPKNDKTWCFWEDRHLPDSELIHHRWKTLQIQAFGNLYSEELSSYRYQCMRSIDYSTAILKKAADFPGFTLAEASITGFSELNGTGVVHTSKGDFSAEWIFQSAIRPKEYYDQPVDVSLKQHFMGIEIKTKKPLFDPDKVMLMDFDTSQKHGLTFFYVLPYSKEEALVEYTFFTDTILTDQEYRVGIDAHLKTRYGLGKDDFKITRSETGAIPMEDRRYPAWFNPRVLNIGTVGGLTKPSTGYTFTRIHKHCKTIVKALEKNDSPPEASGSEYRFRIYDMMLLYLLKEEPEVCKTIFHDLFKKNSFDKILRFLEEETNLAEEISIFASLPYNPFFRAIYGMKHRIFTGS